MPLTTNLSHAVLPTSQSTPLLQTQILVSEDLLGDLHQLHLNICSLANPQSRNRNFTFGLPSSLDSAPVITIRGRDLPTSLRGGAKAMTIPEAGIAVAYVLRAMPSRRIPRSEFWRASYHNEPQPSRPTIPVRNADEAVAWACHKLKAAGLDLHGEPDLAARTVYLRRPRQKPRRLIDAVFAGEATITDSTALWHALEAGIGSCKAWGLGMLHVTPVTR